MKTVVKAVTATVPKVLKTINILKAAKILKIVKRIYLAQTMKLFLITMGRIKTTRKITKILLYSILDKRMIFSFLILIKMKRVINLIVNIL